MRPAAKHLICMCRWCDVGCPWGLLKEWKHSTFTLTIIVHFFLSKAQSFVYNNLIFWILSFLHDFKRYYFAHKKDKKHVNWTLLSISIFTAISNILQLQVFWNCVFKMWKLSIISFKFKKILCNIMAVSTVATWIWWNWRNKSDCEIFSLLDIPWSTPRGFTAKRKCLRITATN